MRSRTRLDGIGVHPQTDALGRVTVTENAARRLVDQYEAEERQRLELQGEHQAWVAERARRRQEAIHNAFERELAKAKAEQQEVARRIDSGEFEGYAPGGFPVGPTSPQTYSTARQAGNEAARAFDAQEPEQLTNFEDWREWRESGARMKGARK